MREMHDLTQTGAIQPLPAKTFDVSDVDQALLYLSKANHIGKVVLVYESNVSILRQLEVPQSANFHKDVVYVLVGGLRGLGRSIVNWMVSHGARKLAILNRSGNSSPETLSIVDEIVRKGANIQVLKCDVSNADEVKDALHAASKMGPIKGIMHAAVVYEDGVFSTLSYSRWKSPLSAKVDGTINLHNAAQELGLDLDFFVMTSSIEAVLALPSQAAYCAGNCFQDAFARYRWSLGLPAISIAFGLISEVSDVGQWASAQRTIARNGLYAIGEYDFLRLIEAAFVERESRDTSDLKYDPAAEAQITCCLDPAELAKVSLTPPHTATHSPRWQTDSKFSHISHAMQNHLRHGKEIKTPSVAEDPPLKMKLNQLVQAGNVDKATQYIAGSIVQRLAVLLLVASETIDSKKSVAHYGVDSLLAVELRNWLTHTFQTTIPLLKLLDESSSIAKLSESILQMYRGSITV